MKPLFDYLVKATSVLDATSKRRFILLAPLILLGTTLEAVSLGMLIPLIQLAMEPEAISGFPLIGSELAKYPASKIILIAAGSFLLTFFFKNLYMAFLAFWQNRVIFITESEFATRLLKRYVRRSYWDHIQHNSAELIRNIEDSVPRMCRSCFLPFVRLITELLVLMVIIGILLMASPFITMIICLLVGSAVAISYMILHHRFRRWGSESLVLSKVALKLLQQTLGSMKEIKLSGREEFFEESFRHSRQQIARVNLWSGTLGDIPRFLIEVVVVFCIVGMLIYLTSSERDTRDTITLLGLFTAAGLRLLPSANRILLALQQLRFGVAAVDMVVDDFHALARESIHQDTDRNANRIKFRESLRFENVSFTYPHRSVPAVEDVSLRIGKGEFIGFVGPSGSGKSTLIDIAMGLYRPQKGRILVDGRAIEKELRNWQQSIGHVPQHIYFFDESLRRNIALGVPEDEIDDNRVIEALRLAHLDHLIQDLPEGLDTRIGEGGATLSGGQRQRVGIARALYNDPDIIFFDEATSALDAETEREVAESIDFLRGAKTVVVVAHRLSTIRGCDRILFIQDKKVRGEGTFSELYQSNDDFRRMVQTAEAYQTSSN